MRKTKFGMMCKHDVGQPLQSKFEVMWFHRSGTPHTHQCDEYAICVCGHGVVVINGESHDANPGDVITIPAGASHHMKPKDGWILKMLIAYRDTVNKQ